MSSFLKHLDVDSILNELSVDINRGSDKPYGCCPLCKDPISFTLCEVDGIHYGVCSACGRSGDLIELAALNTDQEVDDMIQAAADVSWLPSVPDRKDIFQYRLELEAHALLRDFYIHTRSRSNLSKVADTYTSTRAMLNELKIDIDSAAYPYSQGRFFGVSTLHDVQREAGAAVGRRVTPGKNNGPVLVLPVWQIPGSVGALAVYYGRQGNLDCATVGPNPDGFVFFFPELFREDKLVVFMNPTDVIHVQSTHLLSSRVPIPAIGMVDDSAACLDILKTKMPVFVGTDVEQLLTRTRRVANYAQLYQMTDGVKVELEVHSPNSLLSMYLRQSKPYFQFLCERLEALSDTQALGLIVRLELVDDELQKVFSFANSTVSRSRLERLAAVEKSERTVEMASGKIYKVRDNCLYVDRQSGSPLKVSDVLPVVDRIVTSKQGVLYVGRIKYKKDSIPFQLRADEFNSTLLQNMCHAAGWPVVIDDSISRGLLNLCLKLHQPETGTSDATIGWDVDHSKFIFPGLTVEATGDITPTVGHINTRHPLTQLTPGDADVVRARDFFQQTEAGGYASVLMSVIANIGAPALGLDPCPVALCSQSGQRRSAAYSALSTDLPLQAFISIPGNQLEIELAAEANAVPVYARFSERKDMLKLVRSTTSQRLVVFGDYAVAAAAAGRPGWVVIDLDGIGNGLGMLPGVLPGVLSSCLKERADCQSRIAGTPYLKLWLQIFSRWLRRVGVEFSIRRAVTAAVKCDPSDSLLQRTSHMLAFALKGMLLTASCAGKSAIVIPGDGTALLNYDRCVSGLAAVGCHLPLFDDLALELKDNEFLLSERNRVLVVKENFLQGIG